MQIGGFFCVVTTTNKIIKPFARIQMVNIGCKWDFGDGWMENDDGA